MTSIADIDKNNFVQPKSNCIFVYDGIFDIFGLNEKFCSSFYIKNIFFWQNTYL